MNTFQLVAPCYTTKTAHAMNILRIGSVLELNLNGRHTVKGKDWNALLLPLELPLDWVLLWKFILHYGKQI